ncbi:MAG: bifunctional precorrin-2 dehydrogenase/sirohydrochlorin ferrochelatase [Syntrophales bacterium]|jgi:precorrin-2 dehydrogenase/sirohydrochlorin ferrochelatase
MVASMLTMDQPNLKYYPIFLNVHGRRCIVVGGGRVAERKVMRLHEGGASVVVIDRTLTPSLESLKINGLIEHIDGFYESGYLKGAFLVIGATDDPGTNDRIFGDARGTGILVNIVDDPKRSDFILPSLMERGDLVIAVSTGGKSPALAKHLRQDLEGRFGPAYGAMLKLLGLLRDRMSSRSGPSGMNQAVFEALIHSDLLTEIQGGNRNAIKGLVWEIAGEELTEVNLDSIFCFGDCSGGEAD